MPRALWAGPAARRALGLGCSWCSGRILPLGSRQRCPGRGSRFAQGPVKAALAIFDRTFRVTAVLQTIAGVVAGVGLLSAFAALP